MSYLYFEYADQLLLHRRACRLFRVVFSSEAFRASILVRLSMIMILIMMTILLLLLIIIMKNHNTNNNNHQLVYDS